MLFLHVYVWAYVCVGGGAGASKKLTPPSLYLQGLSLNPDLMEPLTVGLANWL